MYLVTIFRIESEIRIHDAISQEVDVRVLKRFDDFAAAQTYLYGIKNSQMMYNFPFAAIQQIEKAQRLQVLDQKLYLFDEIFSNYQPFDDLNILTMSTRRKLHDFSESVEVIMRA